MALYTLCFWRAGGEAITLDYVDAKDDAAAVDQADQALLEHLSGAYVEIYHGDRQLATRWRREGFKAA